MAKKTKKEFSKILICIAITNVLIVTAATFVMMFITLDLSPLEFLIPAVYAEFAAATGFYYNKAKAENLIKLRKRYGSEVYGESGAADT